MMMVYCRWNVTSLRSFLVKSSHSFFFFLCSFPYLILSSRDIYPSNCHLIRSRINRCNREWCRQHFFLFYLCVNIFIEIFLKRCSCFLSLCLYLSSILVPFIHYDSLSLQKYITNDHEKARI